MGEILSTIFSLNPSNIVYISYTYTTKSTFLSRVPLFCRQGESRKLSRSQPLGRNTEGNPPGWYPSPYSFPHFQVESSGFSFLTPKINRPLACTSLLLLLHDL